MLNEEIIFWNNLEKIKDSMLFNDQEFAQFLGLNYSEYLKKRETHSYLPMNCVFEFAEKLNFHFEDLITENFKLSSVKTSAKGVIPLLERYSSATYSEIQPIRNIINYLESVRGLRAKTNLIRKFQLTEDFFESEIQKTNIFLITDIVKYLSLTYKFSNEEFVAMGQRTPFVVKNNFLKDKLTLHKNAESIVSCFFEECTHLFDKNYHYKISSMARDYAIVEAVPRVHVLDELKIKRNELGSEEACFTRMGVISSIMHFKYGKNAPISKISSTQDGSHSNRYVLNLTPFQTSGSGLKLLQPQSVYH